ncbi:hypothetical protein PCASD_23388 [Puccinia coronata f. sp. avenae]|uniref:Uncharacterized protein n=1 Tax=Puccinia coronata f. sp. avenae TaxID=200324 RepID=A0A2N5SKB6_9BASI|nr:hypothetical protein PCASD_23388 [Puccinia coronata f. sp. avenae]
MNGYIPPFPRRRYPSPQANLAPILCGPQLVARETQEEHSAKRHFNHGGGQNPLNDNEELRKAQSSNQYPTSESFNDQPEKADLESVDSSSICNDNLSVHDNHAKLDGFQLPLSNHQSEHLKTESIDKSHIEKREQSYYDTSIKNTSLLYSYNNNDNTKFPGNDYPDAYGPVENEQSDNYHNNNNEENAHNIDPGEMDNFPDNNGSCGSYDDGNCDGYNGESISGYDDGSIGGYDDGSIGGYDDGSCGAYDDYQEEGFADFYEDPYNGGPATLTVEVA